MCHMCGIAGFCFTPDSCVNSREVARALLNSIQSRGRDATGYAYFDSNGQIQENTAPLGATEFLKARKEFRLDAAARCVVLHTRLATKGSPTNPLNNHPVLAYTEEGLTVATVHNGSVWNDDETFRDFGLTRFGQVDTEAIPAMIARFGSERYADTFGHLEGGIATAWLDERSQGVLHMVRAWDSPMVLAAIDTTDEHGTKIKGVMFASTISALTAALSVLGIDWSHEGVRQFEIGEGEYLSSDAGEWDGLVYPFSLPDMTSGWSGRGGRKGGRSFGYGIYGMDGWDDDYEPSSRTGGYGTGKAATSNAPGTIGSGTVGTGKPSSSWVTLPKENNTWDRDQKAWTTATGTNPMRWSSDAGSYVAVGDGSLSPLPAEDGADTPAVLDESVSGPWPQRDAGEYTAWWQQQTRRSALADLADRRKADGYVPTRDEMVLMTSLSESEREVMGISEIEWAECCDDFSWHMELCVEGHCFSKDSMCPASADYSDPETVAQHTVRWGFTDEPLLIDA